jgi:serine/threonine protein kinase
MDQSNHPNIIRFIEMKETDEKVYIVMDYCQMDLYNIWNGHFKKKIPLEFTIHIATQIIQALKYLRDHRIIHRDIKLENILIFFSDEDYIKFT